MKTDVLKPYKTEPLLCTNTHTHLHFKTSTKRQWWEECGQNQSCISKDRLQLKRRLGPPSFKSACQLFTSFILSEGHLNMWHHELVNNFYHAEVSFNVVDSFISLSWCTHGVWTTGCWTWKNTTSRREPNQDVKNSPALVRWFNVKCVFIGSLDSWVRVPS